MNGLTNVNIELTSRCNKACHMCGRRKIERDYPELAKWGDMDYELVKSLSRQVPRGVLVQFHDNGEPLLYDNLGETLSLFEANIRCLDTNGKLLVEKAGDIINNLETITVSTFEGDTEANEQNIILNEFLKIKGDRKPRVIIRSLGIGNFDYSYRSKGLLMAYRQFHSPMGNYEYSKQPTIPEIGICLNALSHLVIKRTGDVTMCVTFDPMREGVIGNAHEKPLEQIWGDLPRQLALDHHIKGERAQIPLCRKCNYWGIATG